MINVKELGHQIVQTLSHVVGIEAVSLYLLDSEKEEYTLLTLEESHARESLKIVKGNLLLSRLQRERKTLVKEELERSEKKRDMDDMVARLSAVNAEVILPLVTQDSLIGFCLLGQKQNQTMYTQEELDLLASLARSAAIALENARLHEYRMKTQK